MAKKLHLIDLIVVNDMKIKLIDAITQAVYSGILKEPFSARAQNQN
jgi:hypothetical protein